VLTRQKGIRNCGCLKRENAAALARKPDDEIGYLAAHDRVRKARGRAQLHRCVSCGQTATNWAYKKDAKTKRTEASGPFAGHPFSPDPTDYQPMCRSCHNSYDFNVPWRPLPKVIRAIEQKIVSGDWAVGTRVRPTAEIASSYGVSETTVYRAFAALAEAGLLERAEGRYVVADAGEDLAGAIPHAEKYDEDPFDVVDDPGLVRRALRFTRSVNATTGGTR
jgi:hypothetical protein